MRKHETRDRLSTNAKLARHRKRVDVMLADHRARMEAIRGPEAEPPPSFRLEDWWIGDANRADGTGRTAKALLKTVPDAWAGSILRAALGEVEGEVSRDWDSERARNMVSLGVIMCFNARPTRLKGRRAFVVRGFTRGAFATVVSGARSRKLHVNTISGVHRTGDVPDHSSQLGYLQALERAGLFESAQIPPHAAEPWERWTFKRKRAGEVVEVEVTTNRYQLRSPNPFSRNVSAEVRESLVELSKLVASSAALRLRPRARRPSSAAPAPAELAAEQPRGP